MNARLTDFYRRLRKFSLSNPSFDEFNDYAKKLYELLIVPFEEK